MSHASNLSKKDYNRFVAFALAATDILIETNSLGIMQYVNGATLGFLGKTATELEGALFSSLIIEDERPKWDSILALLQRIQRVDKNNISLIGRHGQPMQIHISCFQSNDTKGHIYIAININRDQDGVLIDVFERDIYTGLFKKDSFADLVNERIHVAQAHKEDIYLTFVGLPTLRNATIHLSMDTQSSLNIELAEYFRSISLQQDSAGNIGENVFAYLHPMPLHTETMTNHIKTTVEKYAATAQNMVINVSTLAVTPEHLSTTDVANTLHFIFHQFASSQGTAFNIHSLAAGHQGMIKDLQSF